MKKKKYKLTLIYALLLCSAVTSMSTIQAKATQGDVKGDMVKVNEKNKIDGLTFELKWVDFKKLDHSNDKVEVSVFKNGQPFRNFTFSNGNLKYDLDLSEYPGWVNYDWDFKVVNNKKGYHHRFNYNFNENNGYHIAIINSQYEDNTLSVSLDWEDKSDHGNDTVRVQLLKEGKPYKEEISLTSGKKSHLWDLSDEGDGWKELNWNVRVLNDNNAYQPQITFDKASGTFKVLNKKVENSEDNQKGEGNADELRPEETENGGINQEVPKQPSAGKEEESGRGDDISKKEPQPELDQEDTKTEEENSSKQESSTESSFDQEDDESSKESVELPEQNGTENGNIDQETSKDSELDKVEKPEQDSNVDQIVPQPEKEIGNDDMNQELPKEPEVDKVEESGKEDVIQEEVKQPETGKEESSEVTIPKVENEKTEMNDKENQEVSEGIKQPLDKVDEKQSELEKETITVKEEKTEVNKGSEAVKVEETVVKQEDKSVSDNTKQEIKEEKKETQQVKQEQTKERESVKTSDQTKTTAWWVVAVSALLAMLHACKRKFCRK